MALARIGWENGTLVESAKVLSDGTVQPAQYEGTTPLSAANLKKMEDNTETFVNEQVGDLEELNTKDKSNLVGSINEVNLKGKAISLERNQKLDYNKETVFDVTWQSEKYNTTDGTLTMDGNSIKCNKGTHLILINAFIQTVGGNSNYIYVRKVVDGETKEFKTTSSILFPQISCICEINEGEKILIQSYSNAVGYVSASPAWNGFEVILLN